ncbi:MAG TPA: AraC family transcriptional regulator ligand-binding domain-containing protein [Limnobacter sp.]|nr:AraC family transcriptional regulator ligand-binding domain-containing protein [Limnobacter sp.]
MNSRQKTMKARQATPHALPSQEPGTQASWALGIVEALEKAGLQREQVLEHGGIDPLVFEQANARLGLSQFGMLWDLAVHTLGPTAGLVVGQHSRIRDWQTLGLGLASSTNGQEWLDRLTTYQGLITNGLRLSLQPHGHGAIAVCLEFVVPVQLEPVRIDCILQASFQMIQMLFGVDVRPWVSVELTPQKPVDEQPWLSAFGDRLSWGHPVTRVLIQPELLQLAIGTTDPEWSQSQASMLREALLKIEQPAIDQAVCKRLMQHIPNGMANLDQIAAELAMSKRSLQRKLHENGTQFRVLVDRVRHDMAVEGLKNGLSGGQIAERLGFSDASNFHAAFKRWSGMTTQQYLDKVKQGQRC